LSGADRRTWTQDMSIIKDDAEPNDGLATGIGGADYEGDGVEDWHQNSRGVKGWPRPRTTSARR
jgi:hypothetical protein